MAESPAAQPLVSVDTASRASAADAAKVAGRAATAVGGRRTLKPANELRRRLIINIEAHRLTACAWSNDNVAVDASHDHAGLRRIAHRRFRLKHAVRPPAKI